MPCDGGLSCGGTVAVQFRDTELIFVFAFGSGAVDDAGTGASAHIGHIASLFGGAIHHHVLYVVLVSTASGTISTVIVAGTWFPPRSWQQSPWH